MPQHAENQVLSASHKHEKKRPFPAQSEALRAIQTTIQKHDRAQVLMPCGTGKTLVALWSAEQSKAKTIVHFFPSLALLSQTLHEWIEQKSWEKFKILAVCSDHTVTHDVDEVVMTVKDCDFPVTTNPDDITDFIHIKYSGVKAIFCTYQSVEMLIDGLQGVDSVDLVLFDEAHKTAGRNETYYNLPLHDEYLPAKKRLFFTATPRTIRKNKDEPVEQTACSMDNPILYGPVAYELSFREAIERDLIVPYKVIIAIADKDVSEEKDDAIRVAFQKALQKYPVHKIISFHRRVDEAKGFAAYYQKHTRKYNCFHINGQISTVKRKEILDEFLQNQYSVISNARCLTEGIDVPAEDMVAFMTNKSSRVDIVQAIGRAVRKTEGKDCGYVLLPLIIERNRNESIGDAIARAEFNEIWDVLVSLQEQDSFFSDLIRNYIYGDLENDSSNLLDSIIDVIGPNHFISKKLKKSIHVSIVKWLGESWDKRFGELVQYKSKHGDCNVPSEYSENPSLGSWVSMQRTLYKKGQLDSSKIDNLNKLGFAWVIKAGKAWEERYQELIEYKSRHGDCKVPRNYAENPSLGSWVNNQRVFYNNSSLSQDKIDKLNQLGFDWAVYKMSWQEYYKQLVDYHQRYGHSNVPQVYSENPGLGLWVRQQRVFYKENKLSAEKIIKLAKLGFSWVVKGKASWEERYRELVEYKSLYGDCKVPYTYGENPSLARWVSVQRARYKKGVLSKERIEKLEKIGFQWVISGKG